MIKRTAPVGEAYSLAGLVMVVLLASQPAVAASGGSQTHASPTAKRVFFRPVAATARQTASLRWRPHRMVRQAAHGTRPAGRLAYPLGLPAPAPGTSFSIVPRGVPLNSDAMGRRFRPHDPATPSDETAKQLPPPVAETRESRFRPASTRHKQPYERTSSAYTATFKPYPYAYAAQRYVPAPPYLPYGSYWPVR